MFRTLENAENFPEYVQADKLGERHCVMCGQLRLCWAAPELERCTLSTHVRMPLSKKHEPEAAEETEYDEGSKSETMFIIPLQNKGLCSACDSTVWVMTGSDCNAGPLEIKWCKDCKNFRPWAAFRKKGKGMALKCICCRACRRDRYVSRMPLFYIFLVKQNTIGKRTTKQSCQEAFSFGCCCCIRKRAETIFNRMQELFVSGNHDLEPDALAFSSVINAWAKSGDPTSLKVLKCRKLEITTLG